MTLNLASVAPTISLASSERPRPRHHHFVEFYETDSDLVDSLSRFVSAGINRGDGTVVVATPAHRAALDGKLGDAGIDPVAARENGVLISLDAAESMSLFIEDGVPDAGMFEEILGGVIERASAGNRKVRIFGEMVAVLWSEGDVGGALRLEDMWNQLAEKYPFRLFCAYPANAFGGRNLSPLRSVCQRHTHLITI